MDYISGKVTVFVGEASSRVNDTRRRWQQQRANKRRKETDLDQPESAINPEPLQTISLEDHANTIYGRNKQYPLSPLAGGMPFGGDTFAANSLLPPAPPPIGFRTDILNTNKLANPTKDIVTNQPGDEEQAKDAIISAPASGDRRQQLSAESNESLYNGDAWARLWFQRVMILSLLRLLLFIRKVYEDFQATKVYNLTGQTGHFLIAATTLFLPTIVFTIYRVSRYLQITLPNLRHLKADETPYPSERLGEPSSRLQKGNADNARIKELAKVRSQQTTSNQRDDEDEAQLTRALMSSPVQSTGANESALDKPMTPDQLAGLTDENEGLVTARQTPTNLEVFHDSKSQLESQLELDKQPVDEIVPKAPSRASRLETSSPQLTETVSRLESVKIEKLLPNSTADRETTRVVTGASEQLLHGVLYIFWQLKRQVDVMGYLVERACLWRRPAEQEKEELGRLRTGSDGLEWFQDFYAAFLAILAQVYTLGLYWSSDDAMTRPRLSGTQLNAATSGLSSSDAASSSSGGDLSISNSARAISNLLNSQTIAGNALGGRDVLIMSELIVSTAVVMSLLIAVRRRDDGPMTFALSTIGWGSLFSARIIIIALSFVQIGWRIMLPLVVLHVVVITIWIYSIAIDSHNDKTSEREDEAKWDEETAVEVSNQLELRNPDEITRDSSQIERVEMAKETNETQSINETSRWSFMEHVVLLAQILTLFSLPSLFYWPIMFNLKLHQRPFKYLLLILIENFLLIPAIWFSMPGAAATPGQLYLLGFVGGFSIIGFVFISLYISCKPSLTEYFARADELFNEAEKSGIYYEFCSRVFKLPDLKKQTFQRLMNQTEIVEEEIVVERDD